MLKKGGLYIIERTLPQPNWPEGHDQSGSPDRNMEAREDLFITKLDWATGLVIAVKVILFQNKSRSQADDQDGYGG